MRNDIENEVMIQKPFAAYRRVVAIEIANLLSLRRSMKRLRGELAAGCSPTEMLRTPRGDIPRHMLLRYAEVSFGIGVGRVCAARRVLFRLAAGEGRGKDGDVGANANATRSVD
ncbi:MULTISPECIES: hypothetical protein [Massilia]|uniref:hypothetical protein n=1 Tax=Massilia TaxID=149698 RepID=UPI0012EBE14C|nr:MULTISPECIES: hypothetical protein [Massilia]MDK6076178.1 hypothetical protein [Massilia varians]